MSNLSRYIKAQERTHAAALRELQNGYKFSHWDDVRHHCSGRVKKAILNGPSRPTLTPDVETAFYC